MADELKGILVLSLEQAVAAPYASSRLADAGARVIKIERPEGDFARGYDALVEGQSAYFVWLNRGKQSLIADIKDPSDAALLDRILQRADVFIQNLMPGAAARAGFGADALRQRYPRLITCDISGYGDDGPYRDMKAYDLLIQAESGLCTVNGTADQPARVGVSVCDIAAGMYAHQAILQALFHRERTGQGQAISVSLFAAMADWMNVPYLQFRYGGRIPPRTGLHHPTIAPYGAYPCGDGQHILFSIQNEREWARLRDEVLDRADLAQDPRFSDNPRRVANRPPLDAIVCDSLGRWPRQQVADRLKAAKIAYGMLSSLDDLCRHPQAHFATVQSPGGPVDLLAPPPVVDGEELGLGPVPSLGEHTDLIHREFAA